MKMYGNTLSGGETAPKQSGCKMYVSKHWITFSTVQFH